MTKNQTTTTNGDHNAENAFDLDPAHPKKTPTPQDFYEEQEQDTHRLYQRSGALIIAMALFVVALPFVNDALTPTAQTPVSTPPWFAANAYFIETTFAKAHHILDAAHKRNPVDQSVCQAYTKDTATLENAKKNSKESFADVTRYIAVLHAIEHICTSTQTVPAATITALEKELFSTYNTLRASDQNIYAPALLTTIFGTSTPTSSQQSTPPTQVFPTSEAPTG